MAADTKNYQQVVQTAYDAVSALEIDDKFKQIAFKEILRTQLGDRVVLAEPVAPVQLAQAVATPDVAQPVEKGSWQHKIASALGISNEQVLDLYHMTDDGDLELVIEMSSLPSTLKKATRDIAMLYAAGRQAAGIESSTSVELIRGVCEQRFKVVDKKNFSTTITKLGAKFRVSGTGKERQLQLINSAYKQVGDTAKAYAGDES